MPQIPSLPERLPTLAAGIPGYSAEWLPEEYSLELRKAGSTWTRIPPDRKVWEEQEQDHNHFHEGHAAGLGTQCEARSRSPPARRR